MKIYTRTGDEGTTALFGDERVQKDDMRVTAYGTVDEANSALGMARADLDAAVRAGTSAPGLDEVAEVLAELQSLLFDLGADLATPPTARQRRFIKPVDSEDVAHIEAMIDHFTADLPELRQFILPAGQPASAALQLARAIIRRAEREAVALAREEEVGGGVLPLLNRLSDLFFVLARVVNVRSGTGEVPWVARRPDRRPR